MSVELSNWDKFCLLLWIDFCIFLKTYKSVILGIMAPPIFCLVLVFTRCFVDVGTWPAKEYRAINVTALWPKLIEEIETRREKIRKENPNFHHNTFVPQLVIAIAPVENGIDILQRELSSELPGVEMRMFDNCTQLRDMMAIEHYFAGICFLGINSSATIALEYEIIFPSELRFFNETFIGKSWLTNSLFDNFARNEEILHHNGGFINYIREGFVAIQNAIDLAYIRSWNKGDFPQPKLRRFPIYAHIDDPLVKDIQVTISLVLVFGFLLPVANCAKMIIEEKETQVRSLMRSMGVSNLIQFIAWFVKNFSGMALSSMMIVAILKIEWNEGRGILHNSSPWILLIILFAFNMAATSFSILMATFFTQSIIGVPYTCIIWLISYIPYVAFTINPAWLNTFNVLSLCFSNTVFGILMDQIIEFERHNVKGFIVEDIADIFKIKSKYRFGIFLGILYALALIYILLAMCIEKFQPHKYYLQRFWAFLTQFYRRRSRLSFRHAASILIRQTKVYEIEPEFRNIVVRIDKVTKIYNGKAVVRHVSFNLYEGDITVVMGHNGAGKTTLLLMIADLVKPSSGKITKQFDLLDQNNQKHLGVCLDDSMLFPELSIIDQLTVFGHLRGLTMEEIENDIEKYLKAMHLTHRRSETTKSLSNGERSFLAVCCALVGNSKIVLLDDPSKWLDTFARKSLWELLRNERKDRAILLITHSKDEAEALADRLAIISSGRLKCFGSTFFLKKIYGQGHRLICYKKPGFLTENLTKVIQQYFPNILPESELGAEISYLLEDVRSHIELFQELETRTTELGIQSITIAEIDSGDIFLRMGAQYPSEGDRKRHFDILNGRSIYTKEYERLSFVDLNKKLTGFCLFLNHCEVSFIKRFLYYYRVPQIGLLLFLLPIFFVMVSFSATDYQHEELPNFNMTLRSYHKSVSLYTANLDEEQDENLLRIYQEYKEWLFWIGSPHSSEEVPAIENFSNYVIEKQKINNDLVNDKYLVGATFSSKDVVAYFNNHPLHSVPISLNLMNNAIFRGFIDNGIGGILSKFSPLPFYSEISNIRSKGPSYLAKFLAITMSLCVGFIWSLPVLFLVKERQGNFKFLQYLSGIRGYEFWLNNFIFDFIIIIITSLATLLIIIPYELHVFDDEDVAGAYVLLLIYSGVCLCSQNYLASVIATSPVNAYISLIVLNIFGTMSYLCVLYTNEDYKSNIRVSIFMFGALLPHFSLSHALSSIFEIAEEKSFCKDEDIQLISNVLEECGKYPYCCGDIAITDIIFWHLICIFVNGTLCWILLYFHESYLFLRSLIGFKVPHKNEFIDDENEPLYLHPSITNEKRKVLLIRRREYKENILICDNVGFCNNNVDVVKGITLQINRPECFVVVGHNAAGKSTFMNMLVGKYGLSYGDAFIKGISVNDFKWNQILKNIGYSSQDELALQEFTIIEILRMIALLRGITSQDAADIIYNISKVLGFYTHLYKSFKICTTGMRRRLSFAFAIIGNPTLLLLDRPIAGIDLAGTRIICNIICKMRDQGHSLIVSATKTQLCNIIADRVGIMLKGQLTVISDPWELNDEYPGGYMLKMKIKRIIVQVPVTTDNYVRPKFRTIIANPFLKLASFIENEFPMSRVKYQLGNIITYFIPKETTTLAHIFGIMQRNAFILYVEDFLITRCVLPVMYMEAIEEERHKQLMETE